MVKPSYPLSTYIRNNSPLVFGCMSLGGGWNVNPLSQEDIRQAHQVIDAALEAGITLFDHADIYTHGKAEQAFGEVLKQRPELKQHISLQSKCGIRFASTNEPQRYDFSRQWITNSVDGILKRLQIEQLDVLLLHRPDPLMQPEHVAAAFEQLTAQGKVRHFGVSNMGWAQMQLLQSALARPLLVNQLQMSLADINWLEESVLVGMPEGGQRHFGYGTVEYCQQHGVQVQSWGSLAKGVFSGAPQQNAQQAATAQLVAHLSEHYNCSAEAIVLAWLMRHPAAIQPVIGTIQPARIAACTEACGITLSREHWYQLYISSRGTALP